jgi:hypothetical protein
VRLPMTQIEKYTFTVRWEIRMEFGNWTTRQTY